MPLKRDALEGYSTSCTRTMTPTKKFAEGSKQPLEN